MLGGACARCYTGYVYMKYQHYLKTLVLQLRTLPKRYYFIAIFAVATLLYGIAFGLKQPLVFSYGGESCATRLSILPQLQRSPADTEFTVAAKGGVNGVFATKVCVTPTAHPEQGTRYAAFAPFGGWVFRQQFSVEVPQPPMANISPLKKPLSTTRQLELKLNEPDRVFDYQIDIADKSVECTTNERTVRCDIVPLKLAQGEQYKVELSRQFGSTRTKLASEQVKTLPAVMLASASVEPGQVVYAKPREFTMEMDKPLKEASVKLVALRDDTTEELAIDSTIEEDRVVRVTSEDELPRNAELELQLVSALAEDGSGLNDAAVVPFRTSGGPEPSEVSARGSNVQPGSTMTITFDQEISQTQDLAKFIQVSGAEVQMSRSANQVHITLARVDKCADVGVTIAKGFLSSHDVARTDPWKHSFRTSCYTTSTIGYSIGGRAITAYHFGNGGEAILFVGGIHGNERSSSLILHDLIEDLNAKARDIPSHRQVVVVPTINPDGYAAGSRNNASNVNLNRNFATSDWQKDLQDTNGAVAGGGGDAPMSEPETRAIAALSQQLMPRFTLSYHAVGSVVIGNLAGDSSARASTYASQVGYRVGTGRDAEIFDYAISGTYDDWLMQKLGAPSMIVELGSYTYRDFNHHKSAMWHVITE